MSLPLHLGQFSEVALVKNNEDIYSMKYEVFEIQYQEKYFIKCSFLPIRSNPRRSGGWDVRLTDDPFIAGRRSTPVTSQCMAKDKGHTHTHTPYSTARDSERDSTEQASASKPPQNKPRAAATTQSNPKPIPPHPPPPLPRLNVEERISPID